MGPYPVEAVWVEAVFVELKARDHIDLELEAMTPISLDSHIRTLPIQIDPI